MSNIANAVRAIQKSSGPAPKKGNIAAARAALAQAANRQIQTIVQARRARIEVNKRELQTQIRNQRIAQGLTQRQLAVRCGMSQGTITRVERNCWVSLACLLRIAEGLNCKVTITPQQP